MLDFLCYHFSIIICTFFAICPVGYLILSSTSPDVYSPVFIFVVSNVVSCLVKNSEKKMWGMRYRISQCHPQLQFYFGICLVQSPRYFLSPTLPPAVHFQCASQWESQKNPPIYRKLEFFIRKSRLLCPRSPPL